MTKDGLFRISASEISRLETQLKELKGEYDSLKIKQLTRHGIEQDPTKIKTDNSQLEQLKKLIKMKEAAILEIKLDLK